MQFNELTLEMLKNIDEGNFYLTFINDAHGNTQEIHVNCTSSTQPNTVEFRKFYLCKDIRNMAWIITMDVFYTDSDIDNILRYSPKQAGEFEYELMQILLRADRYIKVK